MRIYIIEPEKYTRFSPSKPSPKKIFALQPVRFPALICFVHLAYRKPDSSGTAIAISFTSGTADQRTSNGSFL
ncbi:hypothetical protein KL86DPRO_11549 [uncultured delta proteobacterium]|uniref:Uncharacterized protein n=1 Tax=uncultured delta proteobacterium TaxID=34034 RepID=A0A212JIM1_9DELT|nr:hypothetical protein KL86DPRO_11549 [uncultured delta proteobacterium]